jgi:hypothetical protein
MFTKLRKRKQMQASKSFPKELEAFINELETYCRTAGALVELQLTIRLQN